ENCQPEAVAAVSVRRASAAKVAVHVAVQSMPGGDEVTRPWPSTATVSACCAGGGSRSGSKRAEMLASADSVTVQSPVLEHAPLQPEAPQPVAACTDRTRPAAPSQRGCDAQAQSTRP